MSDEAAFLAALKANPADDTARLVYADWLDEHGESEKAEYLRLVAAPVLRENDCINRPESARVVALACRLPVDWRFTVAARYGLIVQGFNDKVKVIKQVRDIAGTGLGQTKDLVEKSPSRIPLRTTPEGVIGTLRHFQAGPILIEAVSNWSLPEIHIVFDIFARPETNHRIQPGAVRALQDFLVATQQFTRAQVPKLTRGQLDYTGIRVAADLEYESLEDRLRNWQPLLPPTDPYRDWNLSLYVAFRGIQPR